MGKEFVRIPQHTQTGRVEAVQQVHEQEIADQDDVVVFGPDFETTLRNLELVFPQFSQANLKLKPKKCELFLVRKHSSRLRRAPVLAFPTKNNRFILDTDASASGIGAVLSQLQDGEERVICYATKTLNGAQRNYCTTRRELVTFVRQYLTGRKITIRTDHAPFVWLKNFNEPEGILARWISILETFYFEITYRAGTQHINIDAMSRQVVRKCKRVDCPDCYGKEEISKPEVESKPEVVPKLEATPEQGLAQKVGVIQTTGQVLEQGTKFIYSEQGAEFESELFQAVCRKLEVNKTRTSPYNPQSDGLVERFNRTMKRMMATFAHEKKEDWDDHLPYLMLAYRSAVHSSTGYSPLLCKVRLVRLELPPFFNDVAHAHL
ncbi:uncharacterized protein LOC110463677 [Mizuhopecten yessoensis]|uniref:uncharacterized protein LOC110463677 n=1 Tax=Mizuhopecten yessoensis TaxID=6573 RepID=UPI000B45AE02|nr:uncharacterized protein LOC110463677 [Mizuhopecten yessoensis]